MKKTSLYLIFILELAHLSTSMIGIVTSAPTYPIPTGPLTPPVISIESPTGTTYVSWFCAAWVFGHGSWAGYVTVCNVEFSLDDVHVCHLRPYFRFKELIKLSITLGPLSEGIHYLQVFATVGGIYRLAQTLQLLQPVTSLRKLQFTSQLTLPPSSISIQSPQNKTTI